MSLLYFNKTEYQSPRSQTNIFYYTTTFYRSELVTLSQSTALNLKCAKQKKKNTDEQNRKRRIPMRNNSLKYTARGYNPLSCPIGAVGRALRLSRRGSRVQIPAASVG